MVSHGKPRWVAPGSLMLDPHPADLVPQQFASRSAAASDAAPVLPLPTWLDDAEDAPYRRPDSSMAVGQEVLPGALGDELWSSWLMINR